MDAPVHRAYGVTGIIAFQAKVKALGLLLRPGNKQGVINELVNALVPGGGDGNDGDAQNVLQLIDAHGAAVGADLVHHVEGQHHGNLQLHQLHGQVQVPFNVGGVHNIDDAVGPLVHEKVPGDDFLVGVGGQGVDARQVRDRGLRVAADGAVLPVHGDAGEIAHMLIGAGELVKEGGFAAVLVAGQGKGQRALLQGQVMAASVFAHAGVGDGRNPGLLSVNRKGVCVYVFNFNPPGLFQPQGQFIAPQRDLHRVPHGGNLLEHDLRLGGQPHVQQVVPQGTVAAHRPDKSGLAGLQFVHCHNLTPHQGNHARKLFHDDIIPPDFYLRKKKLAMANKKLAYANREFLWKLTSRCFPPQVLASFVCARRVCPPSLREVARRAGGSGLSYGGCPLSQLRCQLPQRGSQGAASLPPAAAPPKGESIKMGGISPQRGSRASPSAVFCLHKSSNRENNVCKGGFLLVYL